MNTNTTSESATRVTGRFANVSFRQLSVRQRPGSIRQRSYVKSYVSSPTSLKGHTISSLTILYQFIK